MSSESLRPESPEWLPELEKRLNSQEPKIDRSNLAKDKAGLEEKAREFEERYPETVRWVRENLRRMDHKKMEAVFTALADSTTGGRHGPIKCISAEETLVTDKLSMKGAPADSYPLLGVNRINGDDFRELRKKDTPKEAFALLFYLHFHENAHQTSIKKAHEISDKNICVENGYVLQLIGGGVTVQPHSLADEGVVDIAAHIAGRQYLIDNPITLEDGSVFTYIDYDDFVERRLLAPTPNGTLLPYAASRRFMEKLSERVAEDTGIAVGNVMKVLIGGLYRGGGFLSEFGLFLDKTIGAGFIADLAGAKTAQDFTDLEKKYLHSVITPALQRKLKKSIDLLSSESLAT